MSSSNISFNKLFTYNLLLYSWNNLKKTIKLLDSNDRFIMPPISKTWLKKTSYLISQGKFDYKNCFIPLIRHTGFNCEEKRITSKFKFKIIENAFVLLLIFFSRNCFSIDTDLIKCLRFTVNFFNKFPSIFITKVIMMLSMEML